MNKDKIVNGYYQPNITTSRGENITYTTEYAIDKLQQENKQLKEVIEEVRGYVNNHIHQETFTGYMDSYELRKLLQILDKVKGE